MARVRLLRQGMLATSATLLLGLSAAVASLARAQPAEACTVGVQYCGCWTSYWETAQILCGLSNYSCPTGGTTCSCQYTCSREE